MKSEVYNVEPSNIYCGDCLELMPQIADKSVDMVLCDLPYGVLNKSNPGAQWDSVIPLDKLWEQYNRIIKDNGAIVLFAQGMFTAQLMMSNPKLWRYNLIWSKGRVTGFLNANRMPLRCHEDICVFYKSLPTYNPQMEDLNGREPNHPQGHGKHNEKNQCYGKMNRINPTYTDKKHPRSIINIKAVHCSEGQSHPTQKPVSLLRYLIRTYTNSGGVILDNCMGSGSTIIAAIKEKRQYIGIEKDEHYFEVAKRRIENELQQLTLF